jgi:hypothetical protein
MLTMRIFFFSVFAKLLEEDTERYKQNTEDSAEGEATEDDDLEVEGTEEGQTTRDNLSHDVQGSDTEDM